MANPLKRFLAVILAATLAAAAAPAAALAAPGGFGNFSSSGEYAAGQFRDVDDASWFALYVESAYNIGFFRGKSAELFDPGGLLTLGESVTLASRLRSIYRTGSAVFAETTPYYAAYAEYALENGIIGEHGEYGSIVTRAVFAELVYNALPPEAFPEINAVPDYGICDVVPGMRCSEAVYALYRAGVLTGSDRFGTFFPESSITRAEACAVMTRLALPAARLKTILPEILPAELIFERCTDAVFIIETFDANDESIRTGTGFFITGDGLAVTNLHVIENAARATVTLSDGSVYPVCGVHAVTEENNLIIFSIESESAGRSCLALADSALIETGNTVYALGSPLAFINTITEGIVSTKSRVVDGQEFIQFTAPISFGSGGSPLLNTRGQVIGIASSSFSYGQNLNLAVPVNFLKDLEPGACIPLEDFLQGSES